MMQITLRRLIFATFEKLISRRSEFGRLRLTILTPRKSEIGIWPLATYYFNAA